MFGHAFKIYNREDANRVIAIRTKKYMNSRCKMTDFYRRINIQNFRIPKLFDFERTTVSNNTNLHELIVISREFVDPTGG